MPFPASPRIEFRNNPLAEVVCQLRFPTVLEISSTDPVAFQKLIRSSYPIYSREANPLFGNLPDALGDLLARFAPAADPRPIHRFRTEDGNATVSLANDFIAIATNKYRRWADFQSSIEQAVSALQIYEPAFYTRIGLRYRNAIHKEDLQESNTPWSELIRPPLIGLLGVPQIAEHVDRSASQALIRIPDVPDGFVTIRYGLPTEDTDKNQFVVDSDFHKATRSDANDLFIHLNAFNRHSGNLFRWFITDRLGEALQRGITSE